MDVHSLTAMVGLRRLFRKNLLTVTGILARINCFFCCFSVVGVIISSCLLVKILFFNLYQSATVVIVLDLKKALVGWGHSHIQ